MHDDDAEHVTQESPGVDIPDAPEDFGDSDHILKNDSELATGRKFKLYKRRWFMLFLFSLNSIGNGIHFTTISAINKIACIYYDVSSEVLNWAPNSFMLVFTFIGLPSAYVINELGLRRSLIVGSSLNAVTCCLHFAGNGRHGFYFLMAGQICAAVAVGVMLQVPAKLATAWFGVDEHATATSIAYLVNVLGMALGFLQSTQMVPSTPHDMKAVGHGIFRLNLSQMIFVLVTLVLTYVGFTNQPPSPPSDLPTTPNESDKVPPFLTNLVLLAKDRDFNLYAQTYGIVYGFFCALSTILEQMVSTKMEDSEIGWMGFSGNISGIVGMLVCGIIVDKYKCYKAMSVFIVLGGLLDWIAFTVVFLLFDYKSALFILYSLFGFFSLPIWSVGVEQVSVTTYPVPEETSAGIVLVIGSLYGFIAVLCFGNWIAEGRSQIVCHVTTAVYFLASVFVCLSRVKVKKMHEVLHSDEATETIDQVA